MAAAVILIFTFDGFEGLTGKKTGLLFSADNRAGKKPVHGMMTRID